MKKPWVIGLLSLIPGLGLLFLGQVAAGLGVMAGMSLLIVLSLVTAPSDLSAWLFVFALILWMVQLGYALLVAWGAAGSRVSRKRAARREARQTRRQGTGIQLAANEALAPLLPPGRQLRLALAGSRTGVDLRVIGELLLGIVHALGGGAYAGGPSDPPTICMGITMDELVYTITRRIPKASDLRRVPLHEVSKVEFKEGRSGFDRLVLHKGNRKLLSIYTAHSLRPTIQEFTDLLGKLA